VIGALNTAGPLILDMAAVVPGWPWQIHALIGFVVFLGMMVWIVAEDRSELWRINNTKPNIILKSIDENFEGSVITRRYSGVLNDMLLGPVEHPNFTRIWVANSPSKSVEEVDANRLYGEISFYNSSKLLFSMGGRWAETQEIADGGQPIEIEQIDLPPNGRGYCMDIGIKYPNEDDFYGYNNQTPQRATKGFRDTNRALGKGTYKVCVRLRCKGVNKSLWFELTNNGANQDISFTISSAVQM
jgi:hypothetical protein